MNYPSPIYVGQFDAMHAGDVVDLFLDIAGDLTGVETITDVDFSVVNAAGEEVAGVIGDHTESGGRTDFRVTAPSLAGVYQLTAVFTISDGQRLTRVATLPVDQAIGDVLFTVAEARAFDKLQLASATDYPDAVIIAKEAEIRQMFSKVCGVDFIPTTYTDEYQDGYGTSAYLLDRPLVTSITSASIRTGTTWTPLTADQLAALQTFDSGELYWDCGYWPAGRRNVKVTYVAGHATVPAAIKRAALLTAASELPTSDVPFSAESYDAGGMSVSYAEGDGYNGNWSRIAEVRRALRLYDRSIPGVA